MEVEDNFDVKFQCPYCQKTYNRNDNCLTHIKKIHEGKKPKCSLCGYALSGSMKRHQATYKCRVSYMQKIKTFCLIFKQ